ncbi:MAG: hypothetical protein EPN98_18095 [Phenylobacterium sp.]|uniref:hypothetical protein n=1 Tax=Phenylobacterium sp. TaxID=1871053 RepID=UPI0012074EEA|nr:hypothetical protein [Phenylobacterium sp.]TAL30031.1 MAG: hypothetical protein EPN98_18095 [Phenylobacterium sp.]
MDRRDPHLRAAVKAKWFSAAFAVVLGVFGALAWKGIFGNKQDSPQLLLMAFAGAGLSLVLWLAIRVVTRRPSTD